MVTELAPAVLISLSYLVPWVAGQWMVFRKASQPPWAALVPVYNLYIMLDIGDIDWMWLLLLFVPIVQLYALYRISAGVARAFGKGTGYGLGLAYLPFVFFPLLVFGDAQYYRHSDGGLSPSADAP